MSDSPKQYFAGRRAPLLWEVSSLKAFPRLFPRARRLGLSLTEILVVITVLGILAALAVVSMTRVVQSADEAVALDNLEHLNNAVHKYNHAVSQLTNAAGSEATVFAELQVDGTVTERPGSPYLEQNLAITSSSDTSIYRATWNGYEFIVIKPGSSGAGIDLTKLQ